MNIEEFITESITGIVNGLSQASASIKEQGAIINPMIDINGFMESSSSHRMGAAPKGRKVQNVEMTVAVSASETDNGGHGSIGINVVGFQAGLSTSDTSSNNSSVSTIKFNVPIAFPVGDQ